MSAYSREQTCQLTTQSGLLVSFAAKSDEALAMLYEVLERLSVKIESTDRLQLPDQASPIQTSIPRTRLLSRRALHSHRYASIPTPSSCSHHHPYTALTTKGILNSSPSSGVRRFPLLQQSVFLDALFASQSEKPLQVQHPRLGNP